MRTDRAALSPARERATTRQGRRHKCPPRCHYCPDMVEIAKQTGQNPRDPVNYTMPFCMGGAVIGRAACHCDETRDTRQRVERQQRELHELRDLIGKYPGAARRMLRPHALSEPALSDAPDPSRNSTLIPPNSDD